MYTIFVKIKLKEIYEEDLCFGLGAVKVAVLVCISLRKNKNHTGTCQFIRGRLAFK